MTSRILCCASSLEAGGSERQLWQLACGIHGRQVPTQVYLLYRRGVFLSALPQDMVVHGWDCAFTEVKEQGRAGHRDSRALSSHGPNPLGLAWLPGSVHRQQVRHLSRVIQENHINVVYDRGFHCTLATAAACRSTKVARVSVIVSPPSRDFGRSRERFKAFKFRLLRRAYSDPKAITLAVSPSVAQDAIDYFRLPSHCVSVMPSPVDIRSVQEAAGIRPAPQGQRSENFVGDDAPPQVTEFRLVLAARMTAEKRHALLLESAASWCQRFQRSNKPALAIDLLGSGPLRDELKQLAHRLGIGEIVHFHGHQLNPYPWIARADAVCIPSQYEGLPNVGLEAMALGTPIIASAESRLEYLLGTENERGIVLRSDTCDAWARAIQTLVERPELSQQIATNARQWVEKFHNISDWLDQMQMQFEKSLQLGNAER